jgi:hypothetical protein
MLRILSKFTFISAALHSQSALAMLQTILSVALVGELLWITTIGLGIQRPRKLPRR